MRSKNEKTRKTLTRRQRHAYGLYIIRRKEPSYGDSHTVALTVFVLYAMYYSSRITRCEKRTQRKNMKKNKSKEK